MTYIGISIDSVLALFRIHKVAVQQQWLPNNRFQTEICLIIVCFLNATFSSRVFNYRIDIPRSKRFNVNTCRRYLLIAGKNLTYNSP